MLTVGIGKAIEPELAPGPQAVEAVPGEGQLHRLSDEDVRKSLDEGVRRGWTEIARRLARTVVLAFVDVVASALAWSAALFLAASSGDARRAAANVVSAVLMAPIILAACGAYQAGRERLNPGRIIRGVLLATAVAWTKAGFFGLSLSGWVFAAHACAGIPLVLGARWLVDLLVARARRVGLATERMLVIGTEGEERSLRDELAETDGTDLELVGRLSPGDVCEPGSVGTVAGLQSALRAARASGVLVVSNIDFGSMRSLTQKCFALGASVTVRPTSLQELAGGVELTRTHVGTLLRLRPRGYRLPQLALKRALDLAVCCAGLVLCSPLLALIAVAIKLDSPGAVFFKSQRAGLGGRPFWMYKFRTMFADADSLKAKLAHLNGSGDSRLFKIKDDPRVTRVGRFLRKTSLDELPQIFNVLRDEMSLVGPRPFFPNDLKSYADHHLARLSVLPGITGLWQVSGRSDVVDFEEVVRLDAEYVRNWSLTRDLVILVRTIPAAFGRGGAY